MSPVTLLAGRFPGSGTTIAHTEANPAAGVQAFFTVPANMLWRLLGVRALFTADANLGDREMRCTIIDAAAADLIVVPSPFVLTAGDAFVISALAGVDLTGVAAGQLSWGGIPADTYLPAGWQVRLDATGIQAGDQWSALLLQAEQWRA